MKIPNRAQIPLLYDDDLRAVLAYYNRTRLTPEMWEDRAAIVREVMRRKELGR